MASRDDVCGAPAAWRECIVRSREETDTTLTSDDEEFFGDHNKFRSADESPQLSAAAIVKQQS